MSPLLMFLKVTLRLGPVCAPVKLTCKGLEIAMSVKLMHLDFRFVTGSV